MKKIAIIISILLVLGVGGLVVMPHSSLGEITEPVTNTSNSSVESKIPTTSAPRETTKPQIAATIPLSAPANTTKYYTTTDVAAHASTQSCWSIVNGKVYDLTSWISRHPGGTSAIKRMCGVDGSRDFNDQHDGQARPEQELASFYIGTLKK